MRRIILAALLFFSVLFPIRLYSNQDWYSYYVQCVAVSSDEESCYQPIREFLSTEEGKKQADSLGFKRRISINNREAASQSVIVLNRVSQMENYLSRALERAKEQGSTIQGYCLTEKRELVSRIKKSIEQKSNEMLSPSSPSGRDNQDGDDQLLLSLNARANEIYQQAQKCMLTE